MEKTVYLLEDDASICGLVKVALELGGIKFCAFNCVKDFIAALSERRPDVALLDIMLPDGSGLDVLKLIKSRYGDVSCIMLSALSKEEDKVNSLNMGADDYISKPFSVLELTARVNVQLRKLGGERNIVAGDLVITPDSMTATLRGKKLQLNKKEYELLKFIATHFIMNPVKTLAAAAARGEDVNSDYSELKPVAATLNEHNRRLRRQIDEINASHALAEAAQISKDEFISNVTHEMNTPLTSIYGYAELLSGGALDSTQKEVAYKTILTQSERLTNLIACIINYNKIDEDAPPYDVDCSAVCREMITALQPEADKCGVTVNGIIDDGVILKSRHELFTEVVGNLMRNAVRYNKAGGSVTVTLTPQRLTVQDTGIGITEENLSKVFSRFFTVDKSHNGKNGGFGLGLAVVKKICNKSGWCISVQSEAGVGSTFTVEF